MGLVWRGKKVYFYRSERVFGRIETFYVASGAEALRCARRARKLERRGIEIRRETKAYCDDLKVELRAFKAAQAERVVDFVAAVQALSRSASEAFQDVEAGFRAEMQRRGFRQHARGLWRKRRGATVSTTNVPAEVGGSTTPATASDPVRMPGEPLLATLILRKAARLLTRHSEDQAVKVRMQAIVILQYQKRARALGAEDADPLVRLLAHRVALAAAEVDVLDAIGANQHPGEVSPAALRKLQWARDGADKRFHRAVRSLELVRQRAYRPAAVAVALAVQVAGEGR